MYCEEFLTPFDLELLDPTGRGRDSLKRMKDGKPTPQPPITLRYSRNEWRDEYIKTFTQQRRGAKHVVYHEFDVKHYSKFGAQGDPFSLDEVKEGYKAFYLNAEYVPKYTSSLLAGRDYFLRMVRQRAELVGYPQIDYEVDMSVKTGSGLPIVGHKGDFLVETVGMSSWRHPEPNLPGQRSQRLKHRIINQDATANVRYIQPVLTAVKNWLRKNFPELFSGWLNPRVALNPMVTSHLSDPATFSTELDYKHCDEHYGVEVAMDIVMPLFEVLIPDQMTFFKFASFVEELFYQKLFFGDSVWSGKHNLFSGQAITNDFETYFGVMNALGACLVCRVPKRAIFVNGDDAAILVRGRRDAERVREIFVDTANQAGLEMELAKCDVIQGSMRFCRKVYYPGLPTEAGSILGAYPPILIVNNVVNPERFWGDAPTLWKSTLQRLDVGYGTPDFEPVTQWVWKRLDRRDRPDAASIENAELYDWWERLYGEKWHLVNSPAYKLLVKTGMWK